MKMYNANKHLVERRTGKQRIAYNCTQWSVHKEVIEKELETEILEMNVINPTQYSYYISGYIVVEAEFENKTPS